MKWRLAQLSRVGFIVGMVLITVLSIVPQPAPTPAEGIDKIEHALAYFLVGVTGMLGFRHRLSLVRISLALAIYGGAMEAVQYFLPSRVAGVPDIVANLVGIAAALIVVGVLTGRRSLGTVQDRTDH